MTVGVLQSIVTTSISHLRSFTNAAIQGDGAMLYWVSMGIYKQVVFAGGIVDVTSFRLR